MREVDNNILIMNAQKWFLDRSKITIFFLFIFNLILVTFYKTIITSNTYETWKITQKEIKLKHPTDGHRFRNQNFKHLGQTLTDFRLT